MKEQYLEDIVRTLRYDSQSSEAGGGGMDDEEIEMPPIDFVLLERLVLHIARDAKGFGVLVFLPGLSEILNLVEVRQILHTPTDSRSLFSPLSGCVASSARP